MKLSEQELAASGVAEMPEHERPLSEEFRIVAKEWVELDGAARLMEETKTTVLAQRVKQQGDKPVAHAERDVKASDEWMEYLKEMVDARTRANLAKVKMEWIRYKERHLDRTHWHQATERKMQRTTP